ncbi:hypothetical protein R6Z07F_003723 [Ovis aries]
MRQGRRKQSPQLREALPEPETGTELRLRRPPARPPAGDAGGAGGPLPRPASPGRLRAAPPAAGGLPSPDLTATEAAGGRSSGSQPSAFAPTQRQPDGGGRAPEGGGLRGLRSGKPLRAGTSQTPGTWMDWELKSQKLPDKLPMATSQGQRVVVQLC